MAADLLKFPLLRLGDWSTWRRWFEAAGVAAPRAHGPVIDRASMLIDAALDGQGIALARTSLAAWDMIHGRLIKPIDVSLRMSNTYWIVCPKATASQPKIAAFRKWLLAEAAEDARRLDAPSPSRRQTISATPEISSSTNTALRNAASSRRP